MLSHHPHEVRFKLGFWNVCDFESKMKSCCRHCWFTHGSWFPLSKKSVCLSDLSNSRLSLRSSSHITFSLSSFLCLSSSLSNIIINHSHKCCCRQRQQKRFKSFCKPSPFNQFCRKKKGSFFGRDALKKRVHRKMNRDKVRTTVYSFL